MISYIIYLWLLCHYVYCRDFPLKPAQPIEANMMVAIRFSKNETHHCLGVILGKRTIMTSTACMNAYIPQYSLLQEDLTEGKCQVLPGIRENDEKPKEEVRTCRKFLSNGKQWWGYGRETDKSHPIKILLDFPLDKKKTRPISVARPIVTGYSLCKVYGWQDQPKVNNKKRLLTTVTILMDMSKCEDLYVKQFRTEFPKNIFCAHEDRIHDKGRVIICDDQLLGVYVQRMPIVYGWKDTDVSIFTFASAPEEFGPRRCLCKLLILSIFVVLL